MKQKFENINRILADWNPLDIPESIAIDEYKGYVPLISRNLRSESEIINCLEDILINQIGLEYDKSNPLHTDDLMKVAIKLLSTTNR